MIFVTAAIIKVSGDKLMNELPVYVMAILIEAMFVCHYLRAAADSQHLTRLF